MVVNNKIKVIVYVGFSFFANIIPKAVAQLRCFPIYMLLLHNARQIVNNPLDKRQSLIQNYLKKS